MRTSAQYPGCEPGWLVVLTWPRISENLANPARCRAAPDDTTATAWEPRLATNLLLDLALGFRCLTSVTASKLPSDATGEAVFAASRAPRSPGVRRATSAEAHIKAIFPGNNLRGSPPAAKSRYPEKKQRVREILENGLETHP